MLSPQKTSSVTKLERASSVSCLPPASRVTGSVFPTENELPSVSVRVTCSPCDRATGGGDHYGYQLRLFRTVEGAGSVTVIVCADADADQSSMPIVSSPAIPSPPLAFTTALPIE